MSIENSNVSQGSSEDEILDWEIEEIEIEEEEVEKKKTWQRTGYPKWTWKPGQKGISWKHLKKPWRKKGHLTLNSAQVNLEAGQIMNWMTFWKAEITNPKAKALWAKPNIPLNMQQAATEFWIAPATFMQHLRKFPEAKALYVQLKEDRRSYLRELAENTIQDWLAGNLDLTWKERVDASFKMLEKTDKAYQPKTEIETKSVAVNIHKSTDDIMGELNELFWK